MTVRGVAIYAGQFRPADQRTSRLGRARFRAFSSRDCRYRVSSDAQAVVRGAGATGAASSELLPVRERGDILVPRAANRVLQERWRRRDRARPARGDGLRVRAADRPRQRRSCAPDIDTVFLPTRTNYGFISASLVREIASHGGDVSRYAPPVVCEALKKRFGDGA